MRYRPLPMSPLLILFLISFPLCLHAKMPEVRMAKDEGPVDIEADHLVYQREIHLFEAHGHVEVSRGDLFLKADHAQLNMATKDLVAWENVRLTEGEDVLECGRLEVNLNTRLGKVYQARLFLKDQNFHITGREAEKMGESHYRLRDGSFTTCDAKRPPWQFTVKELDVNLEGIGIAKGPAFYLEGIPVLYLPTAIFPMKRDRQTGFLLPRPGYSSIHGLEAKNAFFWAIAKNMDATFYFDWLGDRGAKEGLEYRYAFTQETTGQANFYFTDDQLIKKNRYAFFVQHQQKLPHDLYLKGNINHVSDNQYPQDFSGDIPDQNVFDARASRLMRSVLFGGKNWDRFSFLADTEVFQDLTQRSDDSTLQKLPKISFDALPQSLFKTPFFYRLNSTYTNLWREKGVEAQREDLFPIVSYPVRLFNVLKLESSMGLRETVYWFSNDPTRKNHGWESRETLEAGLQTSAEFYRVYDAEGSSKISSLYHVAKWMHSIEPTVSYRYSPRVNQTSLPIFDEVDRVPYVNEVTYGVTQRLVGRPVKETTTSGPYEYAKLKISQSYSMGDPYLDSEGKRRSFSNINAEIWWNFGPYLSAQANAGFSPYQWDFDVLNLLMNAKDRRNDAIQAQYRYTKDNVKEINLDTRIKTIAALYLLGSYRYDLLHHYRVASIYGAEYQAQCWNLGLVVEDWGQSPAGTQKSERKINLYFTLLNLGSVGHKPYQMLF